MKQFIADRHTTPGTPTMDPIGEPGIPLYPTEQDLLDDLANLEVGQIAGTIDPAESELIGVLIQKIQALESKLESDDVYSTDEVKTNKKIIINGVWKDVYRKCYNGTVAGSQTVLENTNDIDTIISVGGSVYKPNWGCYNIGSYSTNEAYGGIFINLVNNTKVLYTPSQSAGATYVVIIEYTKTSA